MTLVSHIPPLERKRESQDFHSSKTHILECQERGSSHRAEDLRCKGLPNPSGMLFSQGIDLRTSRSRYEVHISRSLS